MKAIIRTAKNIALCLMAFTDLLTLLPIIGSIIAFFRKRITAAFIVHPGTINEVQKWWTFVGEVKPGTRKERFWEWIFRHFWPVSGQRIIIRNGKKNVIRVIYLSLTAKLMQQYPEKVEKQSIKATKLAERLGATYIGLGGQVPGNCQYGFALKPNLKRARLTTGHAYSLSMVYAHLLLFSHAMGIDFSRVTIGIVGAGSMGRGIALLLTKNHKIMRLLVVDQGKNILRNLSEEICRTSGILIETSTDLSALIEADIIISVASSTGPIIMPDHIKPQSSRKWPKLLIIEDGYPACTSNDVLEKCEDVVVVAGGGTKMSILRDIEAGFGLLPRGHTVSCFAELVILILMGWSSDYTLGKVDISLMDKIYSEGIEMGFYPSCLSNDRRLNKTCRQEVEPRRMLIKLVNDHHKNDALAPASFFKKQIEPFEA